MKKIISRLIRFMAAAVLIFTSCVKKTGHTLVEIRDDTADQSIIASDELEVNSEFDRVVNEALKASSISSTTNGKITGNILYTTISGAAIDTSKIDSGIVAITYYGKTDNNTKGRTGKVEIRHGLAGGKVIPWKTKGASATIKFLQYEIITLATNKSVWLDGTCNITNISGGTLKNIGDTVLVPGDSLVDKISAKLNYTHNDNTTVIQTWIWHFNQHRVFKLNDTIVTAAITGDTLINNINGVATWGTTRSGQQFYTGITSPVIQNVYGSVFFNYPSSGIKVIKGIAEPITITYGVDQQGNPAISGNPFGYKITWYNSGGYPKKSVVSY